MLAVGTRTERSHSGAYFSACWMAWPASWQATPMAATDGWS